MRREAKGRGVSTSHRSVSLVDLISYMEAHDLSSGGNTHCISMDDHPINMKGVAGMAAILSFDGDYYCKYSPSPLPTTGSDSKVPPISRPRTNLKLKIKLTQFPRIRMVHGLGLNRSRGSQDESKRSKWQTTEADGQMKRSHPGFSELNRKRRQTTSLRCISLA
ncbi:hypothetical protein BDV33DRAFT_39307 [Aspergillus novoparasiticus]|uniref:Uncharacterized protein n=1 Tax=Aspergillus novoparasiticus TaxID=986946 RepID=A0A5N6F378_9EURO|nr:hypothetical protein BDV33DRAFT_39307 [Aspergillus novoparasiticus]